MAKEYRIFISHSWQHAEDLENLQALLNRRGYFHASFEEASRDIPINSLNATYIKARLTDKISNSNVVLALAGIYASHSSWMKWELDKAIELDIPIVGIIPRGQINISTTVSSRSKTDVRWNSESIVEAIRSYAK